MSERCADGEEAQDGTDLEAVDHRRHDGSRAQNDQGILENEDLARSRHCRQHRLRRPICAHFRLRRSNRTKPRDGNDMKVVITGGAGFLGKKLARRLLRDGTIAAAGIIPMYTPEEAVAELHHCHELGLKVIKHFHSAGTSRARRAAGRLEHWVLVECECGRRLQLTWTRWTQRRPASCPACHRRRVPRV